ncbi:MAG: hypothetical protein HKN17_01540 [Rhodothermales bacterium]|nr:hypothetical protein [Rhodothermales bacterium]
MQVVKYFFEEPVALEMLSEDTDPDARRRAGAPTLEEFLGAPEYARGYLAASDLETGRIAASVLPESIALILDAVLPEPRRHFTPGVTGISFTGLDGIDGLREALTDPSERSVIVCGAGDRGDNGLSLPEVVGDLIEHDIREALSSVVRLLEGGFLVLVSEPSHDGHDWSVFSPRPLADDMRTAMAEHLRGISGYVIPFRRARAEHRFYFEQVDPEIYDEFRVTT